MDIICQKKIKEFEDIEPVELPMSVKEIINYLSEKVGAPTYVKTPNFGKKRRKDWNGGFKETKLQHNGENAVIIKLNKLSNKTYDIISKDLLLALSEINDKEEFKTTIEEVLKICSGNIFFSDIYTRLIKDINDRFEGIEQLCLKMVKDYYDLFASIRYLQDDSDYDLLCEINVENEKRKAMGTFISNLTLKGVLQSDIMFNLISKLMDLIVEKTSKPSETKISEEIVENLFILVTVCLDTLKKQSEKLDNITGKMKQLLTSKVLSSKMTFKIMDILDTI